ATCFSSTDSVKRIVARAASASKRKIELANPADGASFYACRRMRHQQGWPARLFFENLPDQGNKEKHIWNVLDRLRRPAQPFSSLTDRDITVLNRDIFDLRPGQKASTGVLNALPADAQRTKSD